MADNNVLLAATGSAEPERPRRQVQTRRREDPTSMRVDLLDTINEAGKQYNVDPNLIRALMFVESRGNNGAVSNQGALGPMQIMPDTARALGITPEQARDPKFAIPAAARLLAENLDRYGDPVMAIRAYHGGTDQNNWGPKNEQHYQRVIQAYGQLTAPTSAQPATPTQAPAAAPAQTPAAAPAAADPWMAFATGEGPEAPVAAPAAAAPPGAAAAATPDVTLPPELQELATGGPEPVTPGLASSPATPAEFATGRQSQPGFGQRLAMGLERGVRDVVDKPAEWLAQGSEAIGLTGAMRNTALGRFMGPEFIPTGTEQASANTADRSTFDRSYGDSGAALAGRVIGNVAASMGPVRALGAAAGGLGAVANATGAVPTAVANVGRAVAAPATVANPLARFAARGALGAAEGGAAAGMMLNPNEEALPQLATGAALGGVVNGAVTPAVGALARGVRNAVMPSISPERAALAQSAVNLGVPVRASQITDSPVVKWIDNVLNDIPLSGQPQRNAAQRDGFSRAVSRTFGEDTPNITEDVMNAARQRIGGEMNAVAQGTTLRVDQPFTQALDDITTAVRQTPLGEGEQRALNNQIDAVRNAISNGSISGQAYQAMTRRGAPLNLAERSPDPNIRHYAEQIRESLDSLLERSAPPDLLERLRTARSQWKAMKTIEPLTGRDVEGGVNPANLLNRVRQSYTNYAYTGTNNELGDLAKIGVNFIQGLPSSGTQQRGMIFGGLANAGLYMMDPTMLATGLGGTAATMGVGRLTGAALGSNTARNMLIRSGTRPPTGPGLTNRLLQATDVPAAVSLGNMQLEPPPRGEESATVVLPTVHVTAPRPRPGEPAPRSGR